MVVYRGRKLSTCKLVTGVVSEDKFFQTYLWDRQFISANFLMQTTFIPITIKNNVPVKLIPLFKKADLIYFVAVEFKFSFPKKSTKFGVSEQTKFPKLSKSLHRKLLQIYYKQQSYKYYLG